MSSKGYMIERYGHLLNTPEAMAEGLMLDATEALCEMMAEAGLSRSVLAKKMNVSKAYITQLLSGSRNMTLQTLAMAAFLCGQKIKISHAPLEEQEQSWTRKEFNTEEFRKGLEDWWTQYEKEKEIPQKTGKIPSWKHYKVEELKQTPKYTTIEIEQQSHPREEQHAAAG
jgi:transcriptional regulator with XRE-family HTH domain